MTPQERHALAMLKMLTPSELLEYVDCIRSERKSNHEREKRLIGMLCALSDALAAMQR